jgi:hypothetical protein
VSRYLAAATTLVSLLPAAALALPVPLSFDSFRFTSFSNGGELRYSALSRWSDGGDDSRRDDLNLNLRPSATGYYWQPWFATWYANTRLNMTLANPIIGDEQNDDLSGIGASLGMNFFPQSRFPFALFARHDDDHRNDLLLSGERNTRTLVGANGSFLRRPGERYSGTLTYMTEEDEFSDSETDTLDLDLEADYTISPQQNIDADFSWSQEEEQSTGNAGKDIDSVLLVKHHYEPTTALYTDSFYNRTYSEFTDDTGGSRELTINQLSSFLNWRPEDPRLLVTGNALLSRTANEGSGTDSEDVLAQLNGFADFRYSDTTDFNASITNFYSDRTETYRGVQALRGNYRRPGTTWRSWLYDWGAGAGARNEISSGETEDDDGFELDGLLNQNLQRSLTWRTLVNTLRHSAVLSAAAGSLDGSRVELNLGHSWSTSWSHAWNQTSLIAAVTLQDDRLFRLVEGDDPDRQGDEDRQRFTLTASARRPLSATESIDASLDMHALWAHSDDENDSNTETQSAHARISYVNQALLQVARLRFTSTLSSRSDDDMVLGIGSEEDDELRWENDLEYQIGRLEIDLEGDYIRRNSRNDFRLFLNLTRRFGR